MSDPAFRRGMVTGDDDRVHATIRRLRGRFALCGAGRIHVALVGQFNPRAAIACSGCVAAIKAIRLQ